MLFRRRKGLAGGGRDFGFSQVLQKWLSDGDFYHSRESGSDLSYRLLVSSDREMPDLFENQSKLNLAQESGLLSPQHDGLADKLSREANLLATGVSSGFYKRASEALSNPGTTALEVGVAAGLAAGFKLMTDAGGRWGKAAQALGTVMFIAGGADIANRVVRTGLAMADNWSNPQNFEANKETVGRYLGSALFDYPLLAASGYAGMRGTELGVSLKGRLQSGAPLQSGESGASRVVDATGSRAADVAAAAEAKFGQIAQVVHERLKMAHFEMPSSGYKPLFAGDGASLPSSMKFDIPAPKPLKFEAARHPSLLAQEAFPNRIVLTEAAQANLILRPELKFNAPPMESLINSHGSTSIVVPILPLSFLPKEEPKLPPVAVELKKLSPRLDTDFARLYEAPRKDVFTSLEVLSTNNLKINDRSHKQ